MLHKNVINGGMRSLKKVMRSPSKLSTDTNKDAASPGAPA